MELKNGLFVMGDRVYGRANERGRPLKNTPF
jgi:hypothetical protein